MNIYALFGWKIHVDISKKSVPFVALNNLIWTYQIVLKFYQNHTTIYFQSSFQSYGTLVNVPNLMQNLTSLKIKNIAFNEVIHSCNDLGDHIKMAMEDIRGLEIFLEKIMSASHFCLYPLFSPVHRVGLYNIHIP